MERKRQIHPDYLPMVQEFQRVFCCYFPNFEDDIYDAAGEMGWLRNAVFNNPLDTVRRSKVKRDIRKLACFARSVSQWDLPLIYGLVLHKEAEQAADDALLKASGIYDFILLCDEMKHEGIVDEVMERFISIVEEEIERLPETRNINWEAVNAVSCLRTLWWRNTGMYAPSRALNPASLFACFLKDGYKFLEVNADPVSAFKRWAAVLRERDMHYEEMVRDRLMHSEEK